MSQKKLRILCLHGYMQTGDMFREKTGAFRKVLKKQADFVCITAPHVAVGRGEENDINSAAGVGELRGWYFTRAGQHFYSRDGPDHSIDFQQAVDFISRTCELEGPFDGILGFSQGACMVSLICAMQQSGEFQHKFRFAILISGFLSCCKDHLRHYEQPITLPTLHCFGENDAVIPCEMSIALAEKFSNKTISKHSGGHFVNASVAKVDFIPFLEQFIEPLH